LKETKTLSAYIIWPVLSIVGVFVVTIGEIKFGDFKPLQFPALILTIIWRLLVLNLAILSQSPKTPKYVYGNLFYSNTRA
jgi:hypothetical protein